MKKCNFIFQKIIFLNYTFHARISFKLKFKFKFKFSFKLKFKYNFKFNFKFNIKLRFKFKVVSSNETKGSKYF